MSHNAPWSGGKRWRQALWFGLPLGLLEFGVLVLAVTHNNILSTGRAIGIGWLLCLLLPVVAGYQFCAHRRHSGWESGWAGWRVGLISCALFLLIVAGWLTVAVIISFNTPPPALPSRSNFHSPTFDLIASVFIFGILAILGVIGALFSAIGGRIGGALAIWRAAPPAPGMRSPESQA